MNENNKNYRVIKVEKLPNSMVEIEAEIPAEVIQKFRGKALAHIQEEAVIPGFRKGHVPEAMLIEKLGEMHILEEAAELALQNVYPLLITQEKLDPIGHPKITITKLALGTPLTFKAATAVVPVFSITGHKEIADKIMKGHKEPSITEAEVEDVIMSFRRMQANIADAGDKDKKTDSPLPELTDEMVKAFGPFENVADFKQKVKENVLAEKKTQDKEKVRLEIIKAIIAKAEIPVPRLLIDSELDRMINIFSAEAQEAGTTFEKYLKEVKKTEIELRKEWEANAIERVKVELILSNIAKSENITPSPEEVTAKVLAILKEHPDADENRATSYVKHLLINEKVFEFLEGQK